MWTGELSLRWLSNHVTQMIDNPPPRSAFIAAAFPDLAAVTAWSQTDHLLAALYDATVAAHGLVDASTRKPAHYPRPHEAIQEQTEAGARRAALEAQAERNRAKGT